jgi:molecular chaperone GrpE
MTNETETMSENENLETQAEETTIEATEAEDTPEETSESSETTETNEGDQYKEKYYYLAAEMQNMQRRFEKEKESLIKVWF